MTTSFRLFFWTFCSRSSSCCHSKAPVQLHSFRDTLTPPPSSMRMIKNDKQRSIRVYISRPNSSGELGRHSPRIPASTLGCNKLQLFRKMLLKIATRHGSFVMDLLRTERTDRTAFSTIAQTRTMINAQYPGWYMGEVFSSVNVEFFKRYVGQSPLFRISCSSQLRVHPHLMKATPNNKQLSTRFYILRHRISGQLEPRF